MHVNVRINPELSRNCADQFAFALGKGFLCSNMFWILFIFLPPVFSRLFSAWFWVCFEKKATKYENQEKVAKNMDVQCGLLYI